MRHLHEILRAAEQRGNGDHQHVNQFMATATLEARVGQLEQVSFQTGNRSFWHPQDQPYLRAWRNL